MNRVQFGKIKYCSLTTCTALASLCLQWTAGLVAADDGKKPYYTEAPLYQLRPDPDQEKIIFGNVGVSGLLVNFDKGVVMKVDKTLPNTPADGKFKSGQIVTAINGKKFSGRNPYVILGKALTQAEATDGVLVFNVKDSAQAPEKKIKISIPVLGAYSDTWPLTCEKSKKIIRDAAQFYSTDKAFKEKYFEEKGIGAALACLFLLSTGDDAYLPFVKEYFSQFPSDVKKIGDHTWNNGYNGIACAEYYLRTGDKSVLPILQYYCDNAQQRQSFGCAWNHWGYVPGPWYVAGGLLNAASAQVLTTLLLAKECGVKVDKATLLGALRFFYRFAGHGAVPYGDHRGEGGLGSNGKDGMIAAAMQVAAGAESDVSLYKQAQMSLSMAMLASYPVMILGHGDEGRGDALWRGLSSAYMLGPKPEAYHEVMNNLRWYYDLCRRPSGSLGVATCPEFDDDGSGAGVALTYTAPLKTLRITGAPPSKYAKKFSLPKRLWGNKADAAFLSIEKNENYEKVGKLEPIDVPFFKYGSAYATPTADPKKGSKADMLKNVYHENYMIRCQAAKALRRAGGFTELEKMLIDVDPRVRRAALDGMIDYNYWFGRGEDVIKQEDVSPKMIAALEKMLSDPAESLWVVDGALMAMSTATPETINKNLPIIMPWLKHEEWWLRESAFMALHGMRTDAKLFPQVLPAMMEMATLEYHTMPRERFMQALSSLLDVEANAARPQILAGLLAAFEKTEIKPDLGAFVTSAEGSYNARITAEAYLQKAPEKGLQTAEMVRKRMALFSTRDIVALIGSPNANPEGKPSGLYLTLDNLDLEQRGKLSSLLFTDYRLELVKRLKTATDDREDMIDTISDLLRLKNPAGGWQILGQPEPADRKWRFLSFDPQPEEVMPQGEKHRFRDVSLPQRLETWYAPEFNDTAWKSGKAPIGVGVFKGMDPDHDTVQGKTIANQSAWGKGEFLLMRTTFKLESVDWGIVRIRVLMKQGYRLYLNGNEISMDEWGSDKPGYRPIMLDSGQAQNLKKGINVLALYCDVEYLNGKPLGQADVYLEGLNKKDLE